MGWTRCHTRPTGGSLGSRTQDRLIKSQIIHQLSARKPPENEMTNKCDCGCFRCSTAELPEHKAEQVKCGAGVVLLHREPCGAFGSAVVFWAGTRTLRQPAYVAITHDVFGSSNSCELVKGE